MISKIVRLALVISIFCFLILIGMGCSMNREKQDYSDEKFKPGQEWKYETRVGEEKSTLKILKVENDEKLGIIVHVCIENVKIIDSTGKEHNEIGHLPYGKEALEKSVMELLNENGDLPDYQEGYQTWKESFDKGKAGIWTVEVKEAVSAMEQALNQ